MDTLDNMRIFTRVVEAGSFTGAARHLNATTAQVSRAIADLESHLRARLLNRTTRRIALTEAGQRYLERCERILTYVDEAEAEAADSNVRASGTLRVHGMTSFGQRYLIPSIARYRELHPEVSVELTLSQRMPDLLDEGYDIGIVLAANLPDSGMISQRLGSVYCVLCASPDYLARHGVPQDPGDLVNHACLQLQTPLFPLDTWVFESPSLDRPGLPSLHGGLERFGAERNRTDGTAPAIQRATQTIHIGGSRFRVNVAEAMGVAISEGMGIGLLPGYAAVTGLRNGSLVRLFAHYQLASFQVHAVYPSRQYIDAKIRTWIDFLSASLPQEMAADEALLATLG
jgi:DNA-binding transcriptional LysR family regulator